MLEKNNLIKKLPLISATVLIVCFFLPWTKLGIGVSTPTHSINLFTMPFNISYTGYDMLGMTSEIRQFNDLPDMLQNIAMQTGASRRDMREMQGMMMMIPPVPWYTILGYLVILIPLFGSAILALNSMGRRNATKITTLVAGSFSMLMFLVMLIGHVGGSSISFKEVAMMMGGPGMSGPGGPIPDITVQLMTTSIGFYLLFLASLGCIVSFFVSFKSDQ